MDKVKPVGWLVLFGLMLSRLTACGPTTAVSTPLPVPTATPQRAAAATPPADRPATPPSGAPLNAADQRLIREVLTTTRGLQSYHFTMTSIGGDPAQAIDIAGDFVAPDQLYQKGQTQGELLQIGGTSYYKDATGAWVIDEKASAASSGGSASQNFVATIIPALSQFDIYGQPDFTSQGVETVHGISTRHFAGQQQGLGTTAPWTTHLWIDPHTGYLHKFRLESNGEAVEIQVSQHNDPSMRLPVPATPVPGVTTVPRPTPTLP